ncbi:ribosomal protein S18-alanine N-acetyltransferase [Paenibacillus sp. NEAU-GSW1]|uniref:ribosomal protein S18-alanine N-acetyltransferase n=1 Tax=Paenibacillus sp. NEAU-GSW1 TaxID=2682486 RepID=UPI0012E136C3|nr:ribosomal protein S18-alanine N-acetyltransferase [Paenibacillus sp. NEAU-GSW1]MUT68466.1 ribosomal-protein-alanine N-acetyltransferase [Paenibacillus sp. NEAU-GSW1]
MSKEQVRFRAMTLEDIARIVEIEQEAFTTPWTSEAFRNELFNNMFARYYVMVHEGRIIGYGGMWIIIDEAHVTNIAVSAEWRGNGLGERLLVELQRRAVGFGANKMTLEVRVSNEVAQRLYRKMGFEPSGIRPGYYSDNQEDALIMWAELSEERSNDPRGHFGEDDGDTEEQQS